MVGDVSRLMLICSISIRFFPLLVTFTDVWFLSSQCVWFLEVDFSFTPSHMETPELEQLISFWPWSASVSSARGMASLGTNRSYAYPRLHTPLWDPFYSSKTAEIGHGSLLPSTQVDYPKNLFQHFAGYN